MASNDMDLTTTAGMQNWLQQTYHLADKPHLEELAGGTANFVWRATGIELPGVKSTSLVIKHAEPFVAGARQWPFDVKRMTFEVEAMAFVNQHLGASQVRAPTVYAYYDEAKVLLMEDAGDQSENLKAFCSGTRPLPSDLLTRLGTSLGQFIGSLHTLGEHADEIKDRLHNHKALIMSKAVVYDRLPAVLNEFKVSDPEDIRAAGDYFGQLLLSQPKTLCMGDYWSGNILIPHPTDVSSPLLVVDWELSRIGQPGMDIGQFLAEAYCLHIYRQPIQDLLISFQHAYLKAYPACSKRDIQCALVHLGAHLMVWTPKTGWTDQEGAQQIVELGADYVRHAWIGDWPWFRTTPFVILVESLI
ncbi:hypothetical protein BZG36_02833 [Bifiguratus adelaidae]|uniref:Aminoglycoside phosphotransferase domain-containing protein n=1 Tax=Bifiguratus adelaidae TaxID=1938954 RepID=A0A261Y0L2_9FUNG|nr:hypothetical protein BZG36_02833 [Bifiguratus adelaidae]